MALFHFIFIFGVFSATPRTSANQIISFRIGATVGRDGSCASLFPGTVLGYQYFFNWLAQRPLPVITDPSGVTYELRLQLRLISHNCTEEGRAAAMSSLINGTQADPVSGAPAEPPVHLLLGGNGDNAMEDALQAEAASRILLHCCTARDTVFHLGLSHVYGLFTPASMYTGTVLRTMALRGMRRVAVVYSRESLLHVQLCEGALAQLPSLAELRPGFSGVLAVNYSATEADTPGFWNELSAQVVSAGADVLIACDGMNRSSLLVHQLRNRRYQLSALWLASSGNVTDFLNHLDGRGEYTLTTVQWMPNLPYADSDFGTAAQYAAAYTAATGQSPSYFSAAATASGYVLLKALRQAISMCSLSNVTTAGDMADAFMWSEGALSCVDQSQRALDITGRSGTAILRYVLGTLNMDTFFGPVGFNGYRQNIYHPVIVAQILSGNLVAVLPLEVAEKALVMPIPEDLPEEKSWLTTPTGITIVTLLFSIGTVCIVLAFLVCRKRMAPYLYAHSVELRFEDIQVDISPHVNSDGSCEPGEGVYRGTRVKLVVANELLQPIRNQRAGKPDLQISPLAFAVDPSEYSAPRSSVAPLRFFALLSAATDPKSPAQRSKSSVIEDASVHRTSNGAVRTPDGLGLRKQQSERFLRKQTESVLPQPPAILPSPALPCIRTQAVTVFDSLSHRMRRQMLALVWRAVRLQHPRMCPVLGIVWEWPGLLEGGGKVPVVVRQWHEFDSLDRLLENETVPLPLMTKANIMLGVAEGLAYLHTQEPPIVAGPLEASRIIMDKNFNPHLFLRLQNLDPEYVNAAASATGVMRINKLRAASVFGGRPTQLAQHGVAPARGGPMTVVLAPKVVAEMAAEPPTASTAVLPFTITMSVDKDGSRPQPRLQSVSGDLFPNQRRLTGTSVLSDIDQPTTNTVGLFAPPPQYRPSKEQDVYEFGLLLCRTFMEASPEDSGRLRFAHIAFAPAAAVAASGGGAAGCGLDGDVSIYGVGAFPAAAASPISLMQTVDPDQLESVLGELTDMCPELGNLARSCVQPNCDLTFTAIAKALEEAVIPALTGCDGLPRGLRRNPLSIRVYGSTGSGGVGSAHFTSGLRADQDLQLRSMSSLVGRTGLSQTMCRSVSVSRPDHLRGVRVKQHKVASDDLLFDIFPPKVARALQAGETVQPERYECVSIFFSDVVGYTDLCSQLQPFEVMDLVHRLYSQFDDLIRDLRLFKVETVGDAYLAVANLRWPQHDDHARLMTQFAFAAVRAANSLLIHPERPELGTVHIRVGLHCGPVVGSVVGTLNRRYCLFGDAVNTAARMEHNSKSDRINCSATFAALLREQWPQGPRIASRGSMVVKGKGPMETFWVEEKQSTLPADRTMLASPIMRDSVLAGDGAV